MSCELLAPVYRRQRMKDAPHLLSRRWPKSTKHAVARVEIYLPPFVLYMNLVTPVCCNINGHCTRMSETKVCYHMLTCAWNAEEVLLLPRSKVEKSFLSSTVNGLSGERTTQNLVWRGKCRSKSRGVAAQQKSAAGFFIVDSLTIPRIIRARLCFLSASHNAVSSEKYYKMVLCIQRNLKKCHKN